MWTLLAVALALGPRVDAEGCSQLDAQRLASALELEIAAEPDATLEEDVVRVQCDLRTVTVTVAGRSRTISGEDRRVLTERSLALAIAPLFTPEPAETPAPTVPEPPPSPAEPEPEPEPPPDPRSQERSPPVRAPKPAQPAPTRRRDEAPPDLVALVRPYGFVHDAPGVGGQLGVLAWTTPRLGLGAQVGLRWGRASRDRGRVDTLVAGGGPTLALHLGRGRLRFRGDLGAGLAYATLAGASSRASTREHRIGGLAFDVMAAVGAEVSTQRVALVPQLVVGSSPGAPIGTVSGERDVSLLRPFFGLGISIEPRLRRNRR